MKSYNLITILGATASGKTGVATHLANQINGEIISADSRQVYRGMDLGTGKDIEEYTIHGTSIPYHLIDIVDAGFEYNVFEYQKDFIQAFEEIQSRKKIPVLCGGSGMYIEAVLKGFKLINVPNNDELRAELDGKDLTELSEILKTYKTIHNRSDIDTRKRAVRAIEIQDYYSHHPETDTYFPEINSLLVGVLFDRDTRRKRISQRLKERLQQGMVEEVKNLLESGVKAESLIYYGLEYKFLTQHVLGQLSYDEMFRQLEIAIHQFSKRQMTWFRHMEKKGFNIHWIEGKMPMEEKIEAIQKLITQNKSKTKE
jgi:tRNA dimethylallyltransferase